MKAYILYLIVSLLFYISGILFISAGNAASGCTFIGLGCVCFVIAIRSRRK